MSNFRDRQRPVSDGVSPEDMPDDSSFSSECPAVYEYLTSLLKGPSGPPQTASLIVFCEDGSFKLCLNDRALGVSTFVSAPTFSEALMTLDDRLQSGTAEWRRSKKGGRK